MDVEYAEHILKEAVDETGLDFAIDEYYYLETFISFNIRWKTIGDMFGFGKTLVDRLLAKGVCISRIQMSAENE